MGARIFIPAPIGMQAAVIADEHRYKLVRAGRRGSKTRTGFIIGTLGHQAQPNGKGMLEGGNILWVPPTIPQGRAIWREEVLPRFRGQPGFTVRETERVVLGPNGGSIEIISAEAIDSARGRRFDGAILDECRDYDLDYVWDSVVRPTLIDRSGWALFISSTRRGSAFNRLAEEIEGAHERRSSRLWKSFHWRTKDNPSLSKVEIEEVYQEYSGREATMQEELDALLLEGGSGKAFPEWEDDASRGVHVVPRRVLPATWRYVAGLDWGYVKGCYALAGIGPEGHIEIVWEKVLERTHARDAAHQVLEECPFPWPDYIAGDSQMWQDSGIAEGTTIADEFLSGLLEASNGNLEAMPKLLPMRHGPGARKSSKNLLHRLLKWENVRNEPHQRLADVIRDVTVLLEAPLMPWARPRLRVQAPCLYIRSTFKSIETDKKDPEDVDTKSDDHGYDAVRYLVGSVPEAPPPPERTVDADRHPGYDVEQRSRAKKPAPWEEQLRGTESGYDFETPNYWRPGT